MLSTCYCSKQLKTSVRDKHILQAAGGLVAPKQVNANRKLIFMCGRTGPRHWTEFKRKLCDISLEDCTTKSSFQTWLMQPEGGKEGVDKDF